MKISPIIRLGHNIIYVQRHETQSRRTHPVNPCGKNKWFNFRHTPLPTNLHPLCRATLKPYHGEKNLIIMQSVSQSLSQLLSKVCCIRKLISINNEALCSSSYLRLLRRIHLIHFLCLISKGLTLLTHGH